MSHKGLLIAPEWTLSGQTRCFALGCFKARVEQSLLLDRRCCARHCMGKYLELQDHVVHLADGKLHGHSNSAQVRALLSGALKANSKSGLVLNFHGGLVSQSQALLSAAVLSPVYGEAGGAYPIFFVWESGLAEAPWNNLREVVGEDLFKQFVKKVGEWLLRKVGRGSGFKGGDTPVNIAELSMQLDAWFAGGLPIAALARLPVSAEPTTRGSIAVPNEDELTEEIADLLDEDVAFTRAVAAVELGLQPAKVKVRGSGPVVVSEQSQISKEAASRLFGHAPSEGKSRGGVVWFQVARAVAGATIRCIRRFKSGRDHGGHATIVEEVLRELYIDKLGRVLWWDRMKGDTADAFKPGEEYGGTAFLVELERQLEGGASPPRITLVGHSTGAIFICHFLRAAARIAPRLQFDVVFQAPAVTHDLFAVTLAEQASRIRNFRLFGMSDPRESADVLVPLLYPSSLLYFVSGMLESEADQPLLGMARFTDAQIYPVDQFPNVDACRKYLAQENRQIWAPSTAGPGRNSNGSRHGHFDDVDADGLASIRHILQNGFN